MKPFRVAPDDKGIFFSRRHYEIIASKRVNQKEENAFLVRGDPKSSTRQGEKHVPGVIVRSPSLIVEDTSKIKFVRGLPGIGVSCRGPSTEEGDQLCEGVRGLFLV